MVQGDDRRAQGESLGDAQTRLFMKGRVDQNPRTGEHREQSAPRYPTLEQDAVAKTPFLGGPLHASLLRPVTKETENSLWMLDVPKCA